MEPAEPIWFPNTAEAIGSTPSRRKEQPSYKLSLNRVESIFLIEVQKIVTKHFIRPEFDDNPEVHVRRRKKP